MCHFLLFPFLSSRDWNNAAKVAKRMTNAPETHPIYYSRKYQFGCTGNPYKLKYAYATRLLKDGETEIIEIPKENYKNQEFIPESNSRVEKENKNNMEENPKKETFDEKDFAHLPKHFKLRILGIRESQIKEDCLTIS